MNQSMFMCMGLCWASFQLGQHSEGPGKAGGGRRCTTKRGMAGRENCPALESDALKVPCAKHEVTGRIWGMGKDAEKHIG